MPRKPRIPLPQAKDAQAVLGLSEKIAQKHAADGAASPLTGELSANWVALAPRLVDARKYHDDAKALEKQLEKLYQDRDLVLRDAAPLLQRTRDLLIGHYGVEKARDLGAHGFVVDDTPRPPKAAKD